MLKNVTSATGGASATGASASGASASANPQTSSNTQTKPQLSLNYPSVFTFLTVIFPFVLVFTLILISIINSDLKGLIYLLGIIILFVFVYMFQLTLHSVIKIDETSEVCKMFDFTLETYSTPSFNTALYVFTLTYLIFPMIQNKVINYPLIAILSVIFMTDTVTKIQTKCTTYVGVILGIIIGFLIGVFYYLILKSSNPTLLYYDTFISSKLACQKPKNQNFKCSIYKNGELIQSI
jgi:hypothetical protein